VEGSKLIIFSTFVAFVSFAFTTIPFISSILGGIVKDKQGNNDKNIIAILIKAFSWHLLSVIVVLFLFSVVDIFLNNIEANFIKSKCMESIFWVAENKASVMSASSSSAGDYQVEGSYSLLLTTYKVFQIFYAFVPLIVMFLSIYIGYEVNKNKQNSSIFNTLVNLLLYVIVGLLIYTTWLHITQIAMFLPSGMSLETLKNNFWISVFRI